METRQRYRQEKKENGIVLMFALSFYVAYMYRCFELFKATKGTRYWSGKKLGILYSCQLFLTKNVLYVRIYNYIYKLVVNWSFSPRSVNTCLLWKIYHLCPVSHEISLMPARSTGTNVNRNRDNRYHQCSHRETEYYEKFNSSRTIV